jgi:serine/threonine-protein kinase
MNEEHGAKNGRVDSEALDRGLAAAFGKDAEGGGVLDRLGAGASRLLLREPPSDVDAPAPVLKAVDDRRTGRYQVLGEIARGGVGVVLKGHDVDLGRDVAMKVLREEHAENADVVQRFVEEAQIGGQLQHPGIVPVYELGMRDDRRPFFTMKLVKGRTLSALLAARERPGDDRRRFIAIFEHVCQTVAYAHSRSVVHRDLKPSNVMVGAFGEVQVVDWGLAKVLRTGGVADERRTKAPADADVSVVETARSGSSGSESRAGSIMGTPAYMPPEQARGEIERVDQRSDVFALGAILCEILTGKPPYQGSDREVVLQAARAQLDSARERIATCGADPELVALAETCLAPAREARPCDAGAVAASIAAYLASIEARARAAELSAAEERAKAAEEKRARRLTVTLAAVVVGAVLIGGCGVLLYRADAAARAADAVNAVHEATAEATLLRGKAATSGDAATWLQALEASRRASALAASRDADEATRTTAAALLAEIESEAAKAGEAAKQAEIDRAMVARLDEIYAAIGDEMDWGRADAAYAEAFRGHGIDVDALDPAESVTRVRASAICVPLALALDEWAAARRELHRSKAEVDRLARVAKDADPDPWRTGLREAKDLPTLRTLAEKAKADPSSIPAMGLVRLADALGEAHDEAAAIEVLRAAQRLHPDDFWCNLQMVTWIARMGPARDPAEVRSCLRAALAARPRSVEVRLMLGVHLEAIGRYAEASEVIRDAVALRPQQGHTHAHLASTLQDQGKFDEAIAEGREAIRLAPQDGYAHEMLAICLQCVGRREEAEAEFRRAVELWPTGAAAHSNLGSLLAGNDDAAGALAEFREAIRLDPNDADARARLTWSLKEGGDLDGAIEQGRNAIRLNPKLPGVHIGLAMCLLQKNDLRGAVDVARQAVQDQPQESQARYLLGTTLSKVGDIEGSIGALYEAVRLAPDYAEAHCNLGIALESRGRYAEAVEMLRRGHELGSKRPDWGYPSGEWLATAQRLLTLQDRLPAVLRGERAPEDARQTFDFAEMCTHRGLDAAAVPLFERAFDADPELASERAQTEFGSVWEAAAAAGHAGTGRSVDSYVLDEKARADLRRRALAWARESLVAMRHLAETNMEGAVEGVATMSGSSDVAGVRDEADLGRLPEEERAAWRAFWADVNAFLAKPREAAPSKK